MPCNHKLDIDLTCKHTVPMTLSQFYVTKEGMIPVGSNRFAALSDDFVFAPEKEKKEKEKEKKKEKKESKSKK